MGMTVREWIDRRKDRIKIVVVPLLFMALGMLGYGGRHGPWTWVTSMGLGVGLLGGIVYTAYVGSIRCPRCKGFIGLAAVLPLRDTSPRPERCTHCGLNFGKAIDSNPGK